MKLALTECGVMKYQESGALPETGDDRVVLDVVCCAICRTDAKMWRQGHRDLLLPRVLGHEIAAIDPATGRLYTVWPGQVCGVCSYCLSGRENLCEEMRIIGFHADGGFARTVSVPRQSLIPVAAGLDAKIVTFAEPVACVFNGLSHLQPVSGRRVIIYGGGVVGMIAALAFRELGLLVTVIEKNAEKIARLQKFCEKNQIVIEKDTTDADFDLAINCCAGHIAFSLCISKLRKGGRLAYFSGLDKNEEIGTNLLNLIHYKELEVFGSYGPRREDMVAAIAFCGRQAASLAALIERVVHPLEVESVLPSILAGKALKYIVDFSLPQPVTAPRESEAARNEPTSAPQLSPFLNDIIAKIEPLARPVDHLVIGASMQGQRDTAAQWNKPLQNFHVVPAGCSVHQPRNRGRAGTILLLLCP